ncbi:MAG: beta-ketoacyl-[acyl-carrier-protein] synthase family protein [Desulfovibrionaceae bacterium]|nr:beta-ketoacyl-[acyl-carrier-protein] synthase family protein [Desulfovibrionaceae bacterium]
MRKRRVVITGTGAVSPYGPGVEAMVSGMKEDRCALSVIPDNLLIRDVDCHVYGAVPQLAETRSIPRELRRTMSPMTVYACLAAREALVQSGLGTEDLPRTGACIGSTMGSGQEMEAVFGYFLSTGGLDAVRTMSFFKTMGHTAASGTALAFRLGGRVLNPCAACAAGLQGIGLAYEAVAFGREDRMLCGGAEEYTRLATGTFDKIGAASHSRDPQTASRPFDTRRDGIVCSEGAGILLLEERESALARGADILAEITGFATISSAFGVASPDSAASAACMREALADAGASPDEVVHVNAHATATQAGDAAEGRAIADIWGDRVPVSSLKGHLGHSLAASGALETAACVAMLRSGRQIGGKRDFDPDPACGGIRHAASNDPLARGLILKNSFALGGIYTSLILAPAD